MRDELRLALDLAVTRPGLSVQLDPGQDQRWVHTCGFDVDQTG